MPTEVAKFIKKQDLIRIIGFVFVATFLIFFSGLTSEKFFQFNNDTIAIDLIANNITHGQGFSTQASRDLYSTPNFPVYTTSFPPFHPVIVALFKLCFNTGLVSLYAPFVLAFLLFLIISISLNQKIVGLISVGLICLLPDFRSELSRAGSIATLSIFIICYFILLEKIFEGTRQPRSIFILFAFITSLLILTRHDALIFLPVSIIIAFIKKNHSSNFLIFIATLFILLAPYFLMNFINTGHFFISDNKLTALSNYSVTPLQFTFFSKKEILEYSIWNDFYQWYNLRYDWFKVNISTLSKWVFIPFIFSLLLSRNNKLYMCTFIFILLCEVTLVSLVPYSRVTRYIIPSSAIILSFYTIQISNFCKKMYPLNRTYRIVIYLGFLISFCALANLNKNVNFIFNLKPLITPVESESEEYNLLILPTLKADIFNKKNVIASDRAESLSFLYQFNTVYNARNFNTCNYDYVLFLKHWDVSYIIDSKERRYLTECLDGIFINETSKKFIFKINTFSEIK